MKDITWLEGNRIQIEPPKRTKKVTGTRFASILGLNVWSTPFEMWCAITKTYEEPFEDTIYTIAGKTIEPKQAEYIKNSYGFVDLKSPTDVYGKDYFNKTFGDFFHENKIFGGMWDFLGVDENGNVDTVFEMKTTKRIEDWQNDVPEYYAMQAALYAYLLGVDDVVMVASFLDEKDYEHPENFVPSVKNTITREFKVSERYPNFAEMLDVVTNWWDTHVVTGISPEYDEKKDADILKELRKTSLNADTDVAELVREAETLATSISEYDSKINEDRERFKIVKDMIKKLLCKNFNEGDTNVVLSGANYTFTCRKQSKSTIDKTALKKAGLLEQFEKTSDSYVLTMVENKDKE